MEHMTKQPQFRITGIVRERETKQPLQNLNVEAYHKDLLNGVLLGKSATDAEGRFKIDCMGVDFRELFGDCTNVYFKVFDMTGERVLHLTVDSVCWEEENDELIEIDVEIDIPTHKLPPSEGHGIGLVDAQGDRQTHFEAGDSLLLTAQGLAPGHSHMVRLLTDSGKEVLSASLISDRYGVISPTALWPDIGIGTPEKGGPFAYETYEEASAAMAGLTFLLEVLEGRRVVRRAKFQIAEGLSRPRLYSVSDSGGPRRGLLLGRDELQVRGRNLPPGSLVDVYLVARQYNWHPGDPIVPVRNPDGSEVVSRIQLPAGETNFHTVLWSREQLRTGSYDMIARVVTANEYRAEERTLRATDLVSDRLITSLVIRDDIFHYKPIHQGCVMAMREIAGKRVGGPPYFTFTNNFPKGTDVYAALDPAGLMPQAIGKKIRYYVVAHKSDAQWNADSSLVDITGNVTEIITTSSCINGNEALVWSNPQQAGKYDLVVDFGNNAPNPANFVPDNSFDPPLDMIDGYLNVGFYVTDDPSIPGGSAIGQTSFNEPAVTIPATGVWSPGGGTLGGTPSGTLSLPLIAEVRYPADSNGVNVPVSGVQPSYPVVVVMHGMHTTADPSYEGYNYLLDHLASQGFIAVSIDCNSINAIGGMQDTRGHAILEHLALLQSKNSSPGLFQGKIDLSRIGIMGHSRGGDGVVQAEIFNQSLGLGWNIRAVVALAPTDFSGTGPTPLNLTTSKFLCIYGSNDGDVWGGANPSTQYTGTGFRFYDRAVVEKAMVFIYGATHNRFNTVWGTESKVNTSSPKILSAGQHQTLLLGYMTAFMQAHLQGRAEQLDYFNGELKIPQAANIEVHTQYRLLSGDLTVDDFESAPQLNQNTLSGTVTLTNLGGTPQEGVMGTLDANSPHQTRGLSLQWNASTAKYQSEIPLSGNLRNISGQGFKFLSFRVSQKVGSAADPVGQLQDLFVRLSTAGGGNSRAVRAGYFATIPFPYQPEYIASFASSEGPNTKAALNTVRMPLHAWTIKALSAPIVDLSNVESITFEFNSTPTGEIELDDIEFSQ
jgi:hypothetical protein